MERKQSISTRSHTDDQSLEEFLENILDTVRESLIVLDKDLRVVTANRTFYKKFQVSTEESIGKLIYELGDKEWNIPGLRVLLEEILNDHKLFNNFRVEHTFPKLGHKVMLLNARHIEQKGQIRNRILLAIEDISQEDQARIEKEKIAHQEQQARQKAEEFSRMLEGEIERRKKIEAELQHSNQELDQFASVASHDLQEPLRMVVSYLQLIERRYSDKLDKDGNEFLFFAVDGATRMKSLLTDLVQYSRINTLSKPFIKTDSGESLNRAVDNLHVAIVESHTSITQDKLPIIYSDRVQLTQLFQNLLVNAIKFRSKRPLKIHVSAFRRDDSWCFSISDNGIGIDKKNLDVIFLVFKQLARRTERKAGSGMGLAIAKKIVTRHGGTIWAESTLGKGTTIYFTIPDRRKKEKKDE